jgi:peptide/nickel transport system substrate-binding protein
VPLPVYHGSFAIGFGSIWVGDAASPKVVPVSPRFRTASPAIRLPGVPATSPTGFPENVGSMVAAHGAIWAAYGFPKRIAKIDPASRRVVLSRPMRQDCPCDAMLAAGGDKLWAVGGDGRHIYRLDPRTGRTLATGALHGGSVTGAAVAGGYLWVAMAEGRSVWKVDETGAPIDQVRTGAGPSSIAAADGYVWVANADAGTVTRIEPSSNATRSYRVGHRPVAVAEVGGTIFAGLEQGAAEATAGLHGPRVVRAAAPDFAYASDPVSIGGPPDLVVGAAAGAGLMAARTGADGRTTIEPELAASPPEVSGGGRTYRFRLRPGLRFSSKEPVTAEAVLSSIERAVAPGLLNHYCRDLVLGDLEGQAAYESGRAEHISGLRVEGDGLAITLAQPSMTLPARLANPCLSVVPAGTPTAPGGLGHPIPSAGPYFASSVILGQQIVLRRNPEYRGPRTAALDAMILRGGVSPEEAGAAVEQGRADYASSAARPSPDFAPGGRYQQRYGAPGGKVRFVRQPSQYTQLLVLNTRRGIFRSERLRRAVNLALDRRAIAGPSGVLPRSLLIPPGLPGHRDQALAPPDVPRARALARGLGGTATLAVPAGGPGPDPSTPEVVRELARIGISVHVRALADPAAAAADPSQGIDALSIGWGPDYSDPFDVVNVILQPGVRAPIFPDFFGDPRWVRRMKEAAAEPLARRDAAYARLDADLARGPAPVAVLSSPPGAALLVSSRLGCLRYVYGLLDLGSLCVR